MKKYRNWVGNLFMWPFKLFPIKKNRIYFISRYGNQYSCNPRAYFEYLYKNHHDEFEFYYCYNKKDVNFPKDVKTAKFFSIKDLYYLHTSKYVVANLRFPMLYAKRKKQVYIQTWHGGSIPYKKIEKDKTNISKLNVWNSKIDSSQMDAFLAGSQSLVDVLEEGFYAEGKMYLTGGPRMDQLINRDLEREKKIRANLGIADEEFVVMFAPTFREDGSYKQFLLDNKRLISAFEKSTKKKVKLIYRFHPFKLDPKVKNMQFEDGVLNLTTYPEMQDLLQITDLLITDFSSTMFEMLVANKPSLIYASDYEEYIKKERGLYIPPKELPFPVSQNMDELCNLAENLDKNLKDFKEKAKAFLEKHGCVEDGHACEKLYKLMLELAEKKRSKK